MAPPCLSDPPRLSRPARYGGRLSIRAITVSAALCIALLPSPLTAAKNTPPVLLEAPPAEYPEAMLGEASDGSVEVRFVVGPDGRPDQLRVTRSSDDRFEPAALAAVRARTYEPARRGGTPVVSRPIKEEVEFRAPWRARLSVLAGREVFRAATDPAIDESELAEPLVLRVRPFGSLYSEDAGSAPPDVAVEVRFVVMPDGRPYDLATDGDPEDPIVFSALLAMSRAEWEPGTRDGRAVAVGKQASLVLSPDRAQWRLHGLNEEEAEAPLMVAGAGPLGEGDRLPRVIHQVAPAFPYALKRKGVRGVVVFTYIVDQRGHVDHVTIESATRPEFAQAILDVVPRWRFEPGAKGGQIVRTRMRQRITFDVH